MIEQGELGTNCFIMDTGECVATIKTGSDVQTVKRYYGGDLFGEVALLKHTKRAASISAVGDVQVYSLSLFEFERIFGRMSLQELHQESYPTDPRKLIADFYGPGDDRGPCGALGGEPPAAEHPSSWFAIFRPCSRDSIAKMLGKVGVGKGLNVKGKSAKKNRLSGFVPFVQIHKEKHKSGVEFSPEWARVHVYYKSSEGRQEAADAMEALRKHWPSYSRKGLFRIDFLDSYDTCFGLEVPEFLLMDAYATGSIH